MTELDLGEGVCRFVAQTMAVPVGLMEEALQDGLLT